MIRLLLLVLLLACSVPAVSAQEAELVGDDPLRHAPAAQQVVMALGGHWAGGSGALLSGVFVRKASGSWEAGAVTGLLLYPLGVAAASYGIGTLFGTDGTFNGTLRGAYIGAGLGTALGVSTVMIFAKDADTVEDALGVLLLSSVLYVGGTLVGAMHGYNASVQPTALRGFGGETVPGARLTISL